MQQTTRFNDLVVGHLSLMESDNWLLRWQKLWSFESISRLQIVVFHTDFCLNISPQFLFRMSHTQKNRNHVILTRKKSRFDQIWFVALEHVYALDRRRRETRTYMEARTWTHTRCEKRWIAGLYRNEWKGLQHALTFVKKLKKLCPQAYHRA